MSVRVVARIRPLLPKELDKDIIVRAASTDDDGPTNVVKIPSPKNEAEIFSFTFNSVYDQDTTQEELFNAEVAPHIKSLFQGIDITLFAYGVTGTGKTHTMRGGMKLADRGVIPRILSLVYRRGKKLNKDSGGLIDVDIALSYYEIYNDKVFDLLEPPEKRTPTGLPLREKDNKTYVVGLSERQCEDLRDFERLYIAANQNRVTASTKLNAHSSRSHAILRVKLTQTERSDDGHVVSIRESTASAIDLAGSEDNRRTDNGRERLVESAAINKSLFVLSQCVDAIARGERRIPYRESKMTRILSLGQNNGITVMILNLAPLRSYHLDTLSSLNVSSRAKRIEVREIENEVVFKQVPRSLTMHHASSSALSALSSPFSATSNSSASSLASQSTVASSIASSAGTGPVRQPLRALSTNAHNIRTGHAAAAAQAASDKPVKAFAVFADCPAVTRPATSSSSSYAHAPTRPIPASALPPTHTVSAAPSTRMGPLRPSATSGKMGTHAKRPSEAFEPRSKLARPSIHAFSASNIALPRPAPNALPHASSSSSSSSTTTASQLLSLTAEQIEAIVERKVAEALAARAEEEDRKAQAQQEKMRKLAVLELATGQDKDSTTSFGMGGAGPGDQLSEAVQKRLDELERRIEDSARGGDDPRSEGLRYLLLARQNKEVGDDAAALRYYEMAVPFFPGQAKLLNKIDRLKVKLARETLRKRSSLSVMSTAVSPRKQQQQQQQQQQLSVHKRKRMGGSSTSSQTPTTPTFRRAMSAGAFSAMSANDDELDFDVDDDVDDAEDGDADEDEDAHLARYASAPEKTTSYSAFTRRGPFNSKMGPLKQQRKLARTSPSDKADDEADDEAMVRDMAGLMTPRKQKLLDTVNSRDVAGGDHDDNETETDDILDEVVVDSDDEQDETMSVVGDDVHVPGGGIHRIQNLAQLHNVPGVGSETVDRAYDGLSMAII